MYEKTTVVDRIEVMADQTVAVRYVVTVTEDGKPFVEQVKAWLADQGIDLWYQDEMGVEGDPRPRRRWIQKGEKGRVTRNGDHIRMNVSGMVSRARASSSRWSCPTPTGRCFRSFWMRPTTLCPWSAPAIC
jgi:hypothetical protein